MLARRRCGCSSRRSLDPVPLFLPSRYHSTAAPSSKRYGKRYKVEGRTNFLERRTGEVRRTRLSRRWTTVHHSPVMYGKLVALQHRTARRDARGALRVGSPKLTPSMRSHVYSVT